ncbi:unnamed protein product [Haemonchus placei]|uniref:Uncharacterized protein n=1 Tax=Haemonchus placei TaxID=6290 RepID=A0A0N4VYJ1_HAEPC|nr:unnamed protein product [Haemonchus placei]
MCIGTSVQEQNFGIEMMSALTSFSVTKFNDTLKPTLAVCETLVGSHAEPG